MWTLALSFLISCSHPTVEKGGGEDPMESVVAAWEKGLSHLENQIRPLEETERWLAIRSLLSERPESSTDPLCELIEGRARGECQRYKAQIEERPHLWGQGPQRPQPPRSAVGHIGPKQPIYRASGTGPSTSIFRFNRPLESSLLELDAIDLGCPKSDPQCRIRRSINAIRSNQFERAAKICRSPETTWQSECFFRAGEEQARRSAGRLDRGRLSHAVDFCAASGNYAFECLEQVAISFWEAAPHASSSNTLAWDTLGQHVDSLQRLKPLLDSQILEHIGGRIWSGAIHTSVQKSGSIPLSLHTKVPEEMAPHVRSAVSFRWVQDRAESREQWGDQSSDLASLSREIAELSNSSDPESDSKRYAPKRLIQDFWREDARGDHEHTAVHYLGLSRRTWSPDTDLDMQLAILEALARFGVADALIQSMAEDPREPLAWTAKRLLSASQNVPRHRPAPP